MIETLHIAACRKPISKSVTESVLKGDLGGFNIDECRVACDWAAERGETWLRSGKQATPDNWQGPTEKHGGSTCADRVSVRGRFPANVILEDDKSVIDIFPSTHGAGYTRGRKPTKGGGMFGLKAVNFRIGDSGSTSRFFWSYDD